MKIYSRVVINMKTGQTVFEDSLEYSGMISQLCPGGSSGEVEYPPYIESSFKQLWGMTSGDTSRNIDLDIVQVLNDSMTADGANPYDGESAFDPTAALSLTSGCPLKDMQDLHDKYEAVVDALSETVDWDTIITKAVSEIDGSDVITETDITSTVSSIVSTALSDASSLISSAVSSAITTISSSVVADEVDAFESAQENRHLRGLGRLAASLAENVNSSAFVFAIAQAEYEFSKEVASYEAKLRLETYQGSLRLFVESYVNKIRSHIDAYIKNHLSFEQFRSALIDNSVKNMMQMLISRVQQQLSLIPIQEDISRASIAAIKERTDRDLELDVNYEKWDLGVLIAASRALASIAGGSAALTQPQPSVMQSALGFTLSAISSYLSYQTLSSATALL